MNRTLFGIVLLGLVCGVLSHSYITSPTSRSNQKQSNTGCRGSACLGPCDVPLARKTRDAIVTSRGSKITIQWPRNNHAGGFIRFAWAPTDQSDTHSVFDNNVHQINCHEVGGCSPDSASDPNGGDSGPTDGSSRACTSVLTVPPHLADGAWTLQWAWFGGAFSLGDYYSCVDYKISGGASGSYTPVFVGGDYSYPGQQKCKFFNTNKLHVCVNEPCNAPIFNGEQSGPPAYVQIGGSAPTPAATTGAKAPTPAATTGAKVPTPAATTGAKEPTPAATTGAKVPTPAATTGVKASTSSPASDTCNGSENRCSGNTQYQTCFNGKFASPQTCQTGLVCKESASSARAYCVRPTDTVREDGTVESSGIKLTTQSVWLAVLALFSVYFML